MPATGAALLEHVHDQRWFGAKSRDVASMEVLETVPVPETAFAIAILEVAFGAGTHELYQLVTGPDPDRDGAADPEFARAVLAAMARDLRCETSRGTAEFHAEVDLGKPGRVRPMGAEQSNTSLVVDERLVLKLYRRLGAGPNPELELLRFLTDRGFPHIAPLRGWYAHTGRLIDATLGIVQDFVPGATDGWDLALASLREHPWAFVPHARALGAVTGGMHAVLASDNQDAAFAPEDTSAEALGLLAATVDEEIEQVFLDLPDLPELDPIRGRGQEVREHLGTMTQVGSAGRVIRHHGDLHLGQVLHTSDGRWLVLDFEGEPARTLVERRRKRSPLRDVAGMLRSFAYAASAAGEVTPEGWEDAVRTAYLDGYLESVDQSLLPPGRAAIERLLAVFELEKAVYELRYELDNRPDWLPIPVAGIVRLLDLEPEEPA